MKTVLVVVCVDAGVHFGAPALEVLAGQHGVGVEDAGELDFKLDRAVEVEDPVHAVLVVGGGEDVRDDELAGAGDGDAVVAEVGVLEQNTGILLVDADGVLDGRGLPRAVDKRRVHVVNRALAIAPQTQRVGHVATAILSQIKRVLALVRMLRVSIRHHHLRQRQAPERVAHCALVVERDVTQHHAFAVVEPNVQVPVRPGDVPAVHLEADALGLRDVDGLEIRPEPALLLNRSCVVVVRRGRVQWAAHRRDINVDNLLGVGVVDRAEVEREAVLAVVDVRAVVHQRLLEAHIGAEALVVANGPRVAVHLVHVLGRDAEDAALLDDLGVFPHHALHNLQVLHGDEWLHTLGQLPAQHLAPRQVDMRVVHLAAAPNAHDVSHTARSGGDLGCVDPRHHLRLARLPQGNSIEEDVGVLFADERDRSLNLQLRQRVEWMRRRGLACEVQSGLLEAVESHGECWVRQRRAGKDRTV
ncbi:hypothetical protein OPT61_g10590 [Boeremia exigua]|uniref:Uncharacterized protein n=1 Tax=Boeremia exigua TaxID=749465 RepID=A0ACC2HPJ1_9PLEO|nr:hypothetical protein OPT61_g10590 [Boeremia exigua]